MVKRSRYLPLPFLVGLLGLALLPVVREQPVAMWSVLGSAGALLVWYLVLLVRGGEFPTEFALYKQHYIQACVQGSVLVYWGWYWRDVYAYAPLILAQLLFAYPFHMLLSWSRSEKYPLGFASFPIVISINLFLWFRPEWFYLQFALIAIGISAKEFIRWERDGRRTHIFNPSAFPLAVASIALLAAGATRITSGQDIAITQFYPPHMYVFLFLIALPGQFLFGVTTMAMSAAVSMVVFGWAYFVATGIYFFYDSFIPISIFLGSLLLFLDPATSPRSELGRIIYGALYGLSAAGLYYVLGMNGLPTFYDKLLQVPVLNLLAPAIDRFAKLPVLQFVNPGRLAPGLVGRSRNLAYMSVWGILFLMFNRMDVLSDNHPGQWAPFWQRACDDRGGYACVYLADLTQNLCNQGSPWACNEAGLMHIALARSGEDARRTDRKGASPSFERGCELGLEAACRNALALADGSDQFAAAQPTLRDFPILLRGSKGEVQEKDSNALLARACRQGWANTCP